MGTPQLQTQTAQTPTPPVQTQELPPREYHYYNADGVFIAKSSGDAPDPELFNNAHYVFDNQNEILKNMDILGGMKKRLNQLRRKLIQTSVRDVEQLMSINRDIQALEQNIERLERGLSSSEPLAALGMETETNAGANAP